tara:strand:- start:4 stop:480 length:477 start_codon:yes stop_codon:yes gene_type:complete
MSTTCGSLTKNGTLCKNGKNCHLHNKTDENTCAICLNPLKKTRGTRELWCGHSFHTSCINDWKEIGKNTCPVCRKKFDVSKYTVTIKIEDNREETSNIINLSPDTIFTILDRIGQNENFLDEYMSEITFDLDETDDLESLMSDLGILPSLNSILSNTH